MITYEQTLNDFSLKLTPKDIFEVTDIQDRTINKSRVESFEKFLPEEAEKG